MKIIALSLCSATPGAGCTTIASHLVLAMQRLGRHAVVLDGDPRNQVRLHFGMDPRERDGWWIKDGEPFCFSDAAYVAAPALDAAQISAHFIPFGESSVMLEADSNYQTMVRSPKALEHGLAESAFADDAIVFITTSDQFSLLQYQALSIADEVIAVATPNPLWQLQLSRFYQTIRSTRAEHDNSFRVLVNQCRPEVRLCNDMVQLMQAEISAEVMIPLVLHQDQHVPEALATQQLVDDYQPAAQFAKEVDALALWLQAQLMDRDNG